MRARTPRSPGDRLPCRLGAALGVLLLVATSTGAAAARTAAPADTGVLSLYQTSYVPEQGNFSVWMQVANPGNVQFAFFTFCQLSNSLCYKPVVMSAIGGGWFKGTTNVMSSYHGMVEGIRAGYNITVEYAGNVNVSLPSEPNPFSNLTVAQTNVGWYMFQMSVDPTEFGLSGVVRDAGTNAPIAGANVTLSPGGLTTLSAANGSYAFAGLVNGTYTLSVMAPGQATSTMPITIAGTNLVQNVNVGGGSTGSSAAGSSLPTWEIAAAGVVAVVVVVGLAVLLLRRRGGGTPPPTGGPTPPGA